MGVSSKFPKSGLEGKSRKELYHEEYEASKKGGEPFFPHTLFKDAVVSVVVFGVIFVLALVFRISTEPVADPTSTTYNPRPEWYFLYLFEFLKHFPGSMEPVAVVIIPGIMVLLMFMLPLVDRSRERHPFQRPTVLITGALIIGGIAYLSIRGALAPHVSPPAEDPLVIQGRMIYTQLQCTYCHSINGVGGAVGPDLAVVTMDMTPEDIQRYLQDPHAMIPRSLHPKLRFTAEELHALSAYVANIGGIPEFSSEAPSLFAEKCSPCHAVNGKGGAAGPDLSRIGEVRSVAFLRGFITNPQSVLPGSSMPAFERTLSGSQISDLANYLSSLRGTSPASTTPIPTPSPSITPFVSRPGAGIEFTIDAPKLFTSRCSPCHAVNGMGGTIGPDLSMIGVIRSVSFLKGVIANPQSVLPGGSMPAFEKTLSDSQISDLAYYLSSFRGTSVTASTPIPSSSTASPPSTTASTAK